MFADLQEKIIQNTRGRIIGMENMTNLILSKDSKDSQDLDVCVVCGEGIMRPLYQDSPVNHCYVCDVCGSRKNIEADVVVE